MNSSSPTTSSLSSPSFRLRYLRWYICGILFFATTVNYVDRVTLSNLKTHLQDVLHWSESDYGWIVFAFQVSYAGMMLISGPIIDRIGTRLGYAIAITWWSIAGMATALARGALSFGVARFFLGVGEAGNFPAAIKAIAEWFPKKERALATGLFNAGTNVGAMVAPPLVVWLTLRWGWQAAFLVTGGLGFVWVILWLVIYRLPAQHPYITEEEFRYIQTPEPGEATDAEPKIPYWKVLGYRQAWGFILAKFMTDPIWWFYVFWFPSYLAQVRGFSLKMIGSSAWIPYLVADVGSVVGGWLSSHWIKRGWTVNRARKATLVIFAFLMPAGILAVFAPHAWVAVALISVAMAAHQGWSANVFTLSSDMFPKKDVGTVVGMGGAAGAFGGMIIALVAGYVLQWFGTYVPLFIIASVMHPLAIGLVQLLIPKIKPVTEK
jgi:ACS family hexuronate transporter-like MFS transporter